MLQDAAVSILAVVIVSWIVWLLLVPGLIVVCLESARSTCILVG